VSSLWIRSVAPLAWGLVGEAEGKIAPPQGGRLRQQRHGVHEKDVGGVGGVCTDRQGATVFTRGTRRFEDSPLQAALLVVTVVVIVAAVWTLCKVTVTARGL
jgi:hypothetical protein